MRSHSAKLAIERAQPWLGTFVRIRVEGMPPPDAHRAIDAAFEEVATVHRLMSFHEENSDVSHLNACGDRRPVAVHPYTLQVLSWALKFSSSSGGSFDVTVGAELVSWGLLPHPSGARRGPEGSWRDIELLSGGRVRFHRPLWIDLGGIAKGYAVDRATERLRAWGARRSVVNAGGDIRMAGGNAERIRLNVEPFTGSPTEVVPVLELCDGSVASSSSRRHHRRPGGRLCGPHVDGVRRCPLTTRRFVCVVAERCVVADALTKVVMVEGGNSRCVLRQFRAVAHIHDPVSGWRHLEAGGEAG